MSESKMREALEKIANADPQKWPAESRYPLHLYAQDIAREALAQPEPVELMDDELISFALDSGFERNKLGWSFTCGKLDCHLLKFARTVLAADRAKRGE